MTSYNPFYDDVKSRKSEASSARHRVGGSKSKKCSLPSDHLTDAQKRKLNGPVREWNIKEPMTYKEFKSMPIDLQQAHLDYIQSRFGIGPNTISTTVFGLSSYGLGYHMNAYGLKLAAVRTRPDAATKAEIEMWLSGETEVHAVAPVPVPDPTPAPEICAHKFVVSNLTADISGTSADLMAYIAAMLGSRDADVHIEIKFKEEN